MAKENSARQAKIGADLLTVENEKVSSLQSVRTFPFLKCLLIGAAAFDAIQGYRMVRAAYGAHEGSWFFEVVINQHSGNTRCVGRPMVARPFPLCWC